MKKFIEKCKDVYVGHVGRDKVTADEVFVVWSCKTLQNKKALVSAPFKEAPYMELTYNGDKNETYVDVYKKEKHYIVE